MRSFSACAAALLLAACSGAASDDASESPAGNGVDASVEGGAADEGSAPADAANDAISPAPVRLATGASVSQINVYQGTEIVIVRAGAAAAHASPLVVGRPALYRVFVAPVSGFHGNVTAQLRFEDASNNALDVLSVTQSISTASTESDVSSTLNFEVPAKDLVLGGKYSVALSDPSAAATPDGQPSTARFPQDGSTTAHDAKVSGLLKISFVPVLVNGGSAPDTSLAQLKLLHDTLFAMYPVTDVQITLHAVYTDGVTVTRTGGGFNQVLQDISSLRQADNPPDDVYYWGTFDPEATFDDFCQGSCMTGVSIIGSATDPIGRVSTGLGYSGSRTATTMAHEVGHAHGRNHAPGCGAGSVDPGFPAAYVISGPYGNFGSIGLVGYDLVNRLFFQPSTTGDMMGYCPPTWVSDYTYGALFTRVQTVDGAADIIGGMFSSPQPFRFVSVDGEGNLHWGRPTTLRRKPSSDPRVVTYDDATGRTLVSTTGYFYEVDHVSGGFLLVPEGPTGFATMTVSTLGSRYRATLQKSY
ncbi:MAG: hypothetical protein ABI183_10835 [Polyangiaceae bacterium]